MLRTWFYLWYGSILVIFLFDLVDDEAGLDAAIFRDSDTLLRFFESAWQNVCIHGHGQLRFD